MSILINLFYNPVVTKLVCQKLWHISVSVHHYCGGQRHCITEYSTCSWLLLNNYCHWYLISENETVHGVLHNVVHRLYYGTSKVSHSSTIHV